MALLKVQDLVCSYTGNLKDKVLEINQLTIDQGEIVFLLGASGSGKSTLLETLGLMNNTLCQGDIILDRGDRKFSFSELWKEDGRKTLTNVRRNNLSFIFQNTNLMENFTAYENICLSSMIKDGRDQQTAMQGAETLMSQIGLPKSEVGISTLSVNLSGGQRQRVSFARALNNDFSLLLCDEPTGNLDETNARELLRIIRENISGTRSAIIVSHDIDLALQFADKIVVINKDPFRGFGEVLQENIYRRDYWSSRSVLELQEFRDRIIYFFSKTRESTISKQTESVPKWHKNYKSLFYTKESKVLFGRKNINLLLVMAITMLTLLAAGFANGSLSYLQRKYNDPFINWLTIHLPTFRNGGKEIDYYLRKLQEETDKGRFLIKQTDTYKDFWLRLFNSDSRDNTWFKGRTIAYDDRLLEDILGTENKISGARFKDKIDISIILTEKVLYKLNYTINDRFIYINNDDVNPVRKEDSLNKIPIPIRAVVKNIPGKIDFIVTDNFYLAFKNIENPVFSFNGDQAGRITLLIGSDGIKAEVIRKDIEELLTKENINGFIAELDTCSQVNNEKLWTGDNGL
jgi:ABC-type lipoprotein export system ATPase subunit